MLKESVFFMVKKTFYNLPEEKRQRIIDAIMKEFASYTYENISINRIIKDADIPRGSFYQYFDDKIDLVQVLTKSFIDLSIYKAYATLNYQKGDLFRIYEILFEILCDFAHNPKQKMVLRNLFHHLRSNDEIIADFIAERLVNFAELINFNNNVDIDNLKYKNKEDVVCLIHILNQILKNAIYNYFVVNKEYAIVKESYFRKLEIIKSGAVIESQ